MKENPGNGHLMSALYELSIINQIYYCVLTVLGFIASCVFSIYSSSVEVDENNPNYFIFSIIVSAIFIILADICKTRSQSMRSQAEKFRKFFFVKDVIDKNYNQMDPYIYYEIGNSVYNKAIKIRNKLELDKGKSINDLSNPYVLSLNSFNEKVIESIQQNCFQTAANLSSCYKWLKPWMQILKLLFLVVAVSLIIGMANFTSDRFNFSQIIIALISLYFTFNLHRFHQSYLSESEKLKILEQHIELIKKGVNQPRMMYYYSEYIAILESQPSIPNFVYTENLQSLKIQWKAKLFGDTENNANDVK